MQHKARNISVGWSVLCGSGSGCCDSGVIGAVGAEQIVIAVTAPARLGGHKPTQLTLDHQL